MKTYIKSSFFLFLLMSVFNIGVSNAYAEDAKGPETNTVEKLDAIILKCSSHSVESITALLNIRSQPSFNFIAAKSECEPKTFRNNNYVLIVTSDCKVYRHKIDPHDPGETFDKA